MKLKKIFLKQKQLLFVLFVLRVVVVIGCVSLIGARIFIGISTYDMDKQLFDAVQSGDRARVQELLELGCNPDPLDEERNTPLYFTSFNVLYGDQYIDIMKLLLQFYANTDQQNYRGETTLHGSVRIENFEKLRTVFSILLSYGADISLEDRNGNTMLTELVRINTMGSVNILLESYADIFGQDRIKRAIKEAIFYSYTDLNEYVLQKYLKQIEEKKFIPPKKRFLGNQLVAVLTQNRLFFHDTVIIKNEVDMFGNNQLHLAVMIGNEELVKLLLKNNKELAQVKNKNGSFPLHFISRSGNSLSTRKKMLAVFDEYGINLNQRDGTGSTLFHIAIRKRDFEFITYALSAYGSKIDREIRDKNKETIKELLERLDRNKLSILY